MVFQTVLLILRGDFMEPDNNEKFAGTRSLPELVRALQIVDSELGFQITV